MSSLRAKFVVGGGVLALGVAALLAAPALASNSEQDSFTPAAPLPEGATVVYGGVIEDPLGGDVACGDQDSFTPAAPLPEGATVVYGGVIEDPLGGDVACGDQDSFTPATMLPEGATVVYGDVIEDEIESGTVVTESGSGS